MPRARACRSGCAGRRRREPAPPWSAWSRVLRCQPDGRGPRLITLPAPGDDAARGAARLATRRRGGRLASGIMRPYHVAIVGSGPSGFFAAASLLKAADSDDQLDVAVDMLEMLPTPWGLVRSGVAPDHPKIKSISKQFEKIAEDERFRFFGNVVVGEHISATELAEQYDAVVYAIGAQADRPLNIPGEELPGSVAAVDFVGWYNAHPHFEDMSPDLSGARAVVVGNGNVALDVARILVTDPDVLALTDIADHALESLRPRSVEEVLLIGRRGPLQTGVTTPELRELADLEGVDIMVDPAQLEGITDDDAAAVGKTTKLNIKVLRDYAAREPHPGNRRIVFRFFTSP